MTPSQDTPQTSAPATPVAYPAMNPTDGIDVARAEPRAFEPDDAVPPDDDGSPKAERPDHFSGPTGDPAEGKP